MTFNSIFFIIFFLPVSIILYYITPAKYKPAVLLGISSVYCGMISIYLLILIYILIPVNFILARNIEKKSRKIIYILTIAINIFLLLALKTRTVLLGIMPVYAENIFLPVCVSFFMLKFIGYITDVYRKRISAEKNFLSFALYILFFPGFLMGPVISYHEFLPFFKRSGINLSILGRGLIMFIKGLSKNVIIGGSLYPLWQTVCNIPPERLSSFSAILGISAFALSFYFCLSGTMDMSAGISCCFGYKFPPDFDHPFFAPGLSVFFSGWHISIIKWFRKYILNPLSEKVPVSVSYIIMWILIGLWYELSWNKLIWGLIIGLGTVIERLSKKKSIIYTFFVTSLSWIFFSQSSLNNSLLMIKSILGGSRHIIDSLSLYLLKSYAVILLIAIYASTDLFKNLTEKIKDSRYFSFWFSIIMPFVDLILLIVSIAIITAGGSSSLSSMFG